MADARIPKYKGRGRPVNWEKRLAFLDALERTRSVTAAQRELGVQDSVLWRWRQDDAFRLREEAVRSKDCRWVRPPPLAEFIEKYWPAPVDVDEGGDPRLTYPHQEEWHEVLLDPKRRRKLLLAPVGHAKTTRMVQYLLWRVLQDRNLRVLYISRSEGAAADVVGQFAQALSDDALFEDLHATFGPKFQSDGMPWTRRFLYIHGRTISEKDPTLQARGVGTQVYGKRADIIVLDDVDAPTLTPAARAHTWDWIQTVVKSRLVPKGELVTIGTRCDEYDIYSRFMAQAETHPDRWSLVVQRALSDDGEPLWPERFSKEWLEAERDEDPRSFSLVYQNDPGSQGERDFTPETIELAKDKGLARGQVDPGCRVVVSLDPATNGPAAMVAVSFRRGEDLSASAIDLWMDKNLRGEGLRSWVKEAFERYPQSKDLVIESGASLSGHLVHDDRELGDWLALRGVRVHKHYTTGHNKPDADYGVSGMAPAMNRKLLRIAWGDNPARLVMIRLVEELLGYHPESKRPHDAVMALWFAWFWIIQNASSGKPARKSAWRQMTPWLRSA